MTGPLGAAVRVQVVLRPADEATRRRLAELVLGVPDAPAPPPAPARRPVETPGDAHPAPSAPRGPGPLALRVGAVLDRVGALVAPVLAAWQRLLPDPDDEPVPSDLSEARLALPVTGASGVLDPPGSGPDPPVDPLFLPRWTSAVLRTALAVERPTGPVDVGRLVGDMARLRFPARLPRRRRWQLAPAVQVLADLSEDMLPHRADVLGLLGTLRRVVGEDRVTVLRFAGRPMTAVGPGDRRTWGPYRPPPVPQPVLLLSTLGSSAADPLDGGSLGRELGRLTRLLHRSGCRVLAFVPNSASRVPAAHRRGLGVVEWDRTTSPGTVRRVVRR